MLSLKKVKRIKKFVTTFICAAIIITSTSVGNVFAESNDKDIYSQNFTEKVSYEGVDYIYHYFYNEEGKKSIKISNTETSNKDLLTFDENNNSVYLNEKKVATVGDTFEDLNPKDNNNGISSRIKWNLIGVYHHKIKFHEGVGGVFVAGIIVGTMGFGTVGAAMASCGASAMGAIAGCAPGGTLHWSKYYYTEITHYRYRTDWAFKASSGERYGTYYLYTTAD